MRSLLSERDYRIILILEILMANEWVSLTTMTDYLDCSEKTIRNDLGLISTEFEEIIIESSPQQGYHLVRQNNFPIENTVDQIINNTLIFQLLQLLLENSNLKLTELESLLFVSANSIRNTVKDFNRLLKMDGVTIESRPFRIEGDEVKITSLFFIRLQQSYFSRGMVEDKIFNFIQELIPLLFANNPQLEKAFRDDQHSLNILLYIRFFREKNGHNIHKKELVDIMDYPLLKDKDIVKNFYKIFNIPLNNDIINRSIEFILTEKIAFNYLQLIYLFENSVENKEINQSIRKISDNIITNLSLKPFSNREFKEIILTDDLYSKNNSIGYDVHLVLLELLKYEQNKLFEEQKNFKDETFFYNVILIQLAYFLQKNCPELEDRLKCITKKMSVTILLITNRSNQNLFKEYFAYHFGRLIDFSFIDVYDPDIKTDLLITNTYDYFKMDTPVLNIASLPNSQLFNDIMSFLYDYRIKKYLNFSDLYDKETAFNDE